VVSLPNFNLYFGIFMATFFGLSGRMVSSRSAWLYMFLGIGFVSLSMPNVYAVEPTVVTNPKPLVISEGNAQDLKGTLSRDASLWLGGVGGDDGSGIDENVYEISEDSYNIRVKNLNQSLELKDQQMGESQRIIRRVPLN
jgi:hypothetical protein